MKFIFLLVLAAILSGCSNPGKSKGRLVDQFEEAVEESEEIVFIDSSNLGASMDGSILSLHFLPSFQVRLYTWGNGFSNYAGTYKFTENNGIELSIGKQSWPGLRLSKRNGLFNLERQDGLKSLTKSHILTDRDGVVTRIDDADIYPQARSLIFPLTQRTETAEGADDQLPARDESEAQ